MRYINALYFRLYSLLTNWDDKKVVLIVSSGRTGTNFMAHWFDSLSNNIYSVHEPSPDLFTIGINKYRLNINKENIIKLIKKARLKQLYRLNKNDINIYIESNPNLILLLSELNKIFKNLKIIFIKREFEGYVLSALNKSPDNSNINFFYGNSDSRSRITPLDMDQELYKNKWNLLSREEKVAWWWKTSNDIIDKYKKDYNNSIVVNFEDIFNDNNISVLKSILKDLNLNYNITKEQLKLFKQKKNTNKIKIINDYDDIDSKVRESMEEIANVIIK